MASSSPEWASERLRQLLEELEQEHGNRPEKSPLVLELTNNIHRYIGLAQEYKAVVSNQRLVRLLPDHVGFATAIKTGIMDGSMLYGLDQLATMFLDSWKGLILTIVAHLLWLLIDPGLKCDRPLGLKLLRCAIIIFGSSYFYSFGGTNLCVAISGFVDHILWRLNAYYQGLQSNGDCISHILKDSLVLFLFVVIPTILPAPGAIGRTDWPFPRYILMEWDWKSSMAPAMFPLIYELFVVIRKFYRHFRRITNFHLPRIFHLATIMTQKSFQMVSVQSRRTVLHLLLTKCSLKYEPIDRSKNQIRLLELEQCTEFSEIRCTLVSKSLDDIEPFEAISYRWSQSDPLLPILVNEKRILVSLTVYLLLQSLRTRSDSRRMLWIDSVCINQQDEVEKCWQIPLMSKIYSSATRVIAWVGGSPTSAGSLRYISELSAALDPKFPSEIWDSIKNPENAKKFNRNWTAVQSLLDHEWFSRVWVMQEVAFAKDLLLRHSIDEEIHWDTLNLVVSEALRRSNGRFLFDVEASAKSSTGKDLRHNNLKIITMMSEVRRQIQNSPDKPTMDLSLAMLLTASLDSTAEKDRIYGLLGLTSEETRNIVQVNYQEETRDVILRAARHSLLHERTGILAFNMCCQGPATLESRKAFQELKLPTWCPDWFTQGAERASPSGGNQRTAIHLRPNTRDVEDYPERLIFRGCDLDRVLACSGEIPILASGMSQSESVIQEFIETGIELCQRVPWSIYRLTPRDLFWHTVLTDIGESPGSNTVRELNRKLDNFKAKSSIWSPWMLPYSLEAYNPYFEAGRVWDKIGRIMVGKRFSLTESRRVAIVPEETIAGDRICVIFGAGTPFVVRPKMGTAIEPGKPNIFVGPCYVHGITNGELDNGRPLPAQDLLID